MAGAFYRMRDFPLVSGAQSGFSALSDFSETGKKPSEYDDVAEINILDVFFAEIALHKIRTVYSSRQFLHLPL